MQNILNIYIYHFERLLDFQKQIGVTINSLDNIKPEALSDDLRNYSEQDLLTYNDDNYMALDD